MLTDIDKGHLSSTISLISASAGTGKTTRIAEELAALLSGAEPDFKADKLLLCTFTTKAAAELLARARSKLISLGNHEASGMLYASYSGTINSVCSQILKDYALLAGLSPSQNVIPEQLALQVFNRAVEPVLEKFSGKIQECAARLQYDGIGSEQASAFSSRSWTESVKKICDAARSNNIPADCLRKSASLSSSVLRDLYSNCKRATFALDESEDWNSAFRDTLDLTLQKLRDGNDSTLKTAEAVKLLEDLEFKFSKGNWTWADWAKISKLDVAKESKSAVSRLVEIAGMHFAHPGLLVDLDNFVELVFDCASECLDKFQESKRQAGILDFIDQELLVLKLLERQDVCESLRSRIELVIVDEFQDSSPIQLQIFVKLAELARRSLWVGDLKQAIYGFRGTDPSLIQAVADALGESEILAKSYRSCRDLVDFSNACFSAVFPQYGCPSENVSIECGRVGEEREQAAIEYWQCAGKNLEDCAVSLSDGINSILNGNAPIRIHDKHSCGVRPLRGADIAVLCRSNDRAEKVADALALNGIRAAIPTDGLLDTPECLLVSASLRYLYNPSDTLALATLVKFETAQNEYNSSTWLELWLQTEKDKRRFLLPSHEEYEESRIRLSQMSLSESLEQALRICGALEKCAGWGKFRERLSNLDAFRSLLQKHQDEVKVKGGTVSLYGFMQYLAQLKTAEKPAAVDPNAVNVLTYHGAKGLEWPVVILCDLDSSSTPEPSTDYFDVSVQSSVKRLDLSNPLAERWIRFLPWPYGRQKKGVGVDEAVQDIADFREFSKRQAYENLRLLYVGVTRARELLILAPYVGRRGAGSGTQWLDELFADGKPVIAPPVLGDEFLRVNGTEHRVIVRRYCREERGELTPRQGIPDANLRNMQSKDPPVYLPFCRLTGAVEFDSYVLAPGGRHSTWPEQLKVSMYSLGCGLAVSPETHTIKDLGNLVHAFLASDDHTQGSEYRLFHAESLIRIWLQNDLKAEDLLQAGCNLREFIESKFPHAVWMRECPVRGKLGLQRVHGVVDVLLETPASFYIVDHKTFLAKDELEIIEKCKGFYGQLNIYKHVIEQCGAKPVAGIFVHLPLLGKIAELSVD